MALNEPRTIPREFRVFALDDIAYLFDNSERTYLCCATPSIWAVPLYWLDGSDDYDLPDPDYFSESYIGRRFDELGIPVQLNAEILSPEYDEDEAWKDAMEETNANHYV